MLPRAAALKIFEGFEIKGEKEGGWPMVNMLVLWRPWTAAAAASPSPSMGW